MANFTIQMDAQQASTTAQVWSGQLTSLCTIQAPDGARSPDNAPSGNYANVAGLINIPCKDAVLTDGSIQATEAKELEEIMSRSYRHVMLNGYYPTLFRDAVFTGGPGGQQMGWQAIVDGITYDLLGAEPDSFNTQTRLKLQLVTISNQGAG